MKILHYAYFFISFMCTFDKQNILQHIFCIFTFPDNMKLPGTDNFPAPGRAVCSYYAIIFSNATRLSCPVTIQNRRRRRHHNYSLFTSHTLIPSSLVSARTVVKSLSSQSKLPVVTVLPQYSHLPELEISSGAPQLGQNFG